MRSVHLVFLVLFVMFSFTDIKYALGGFKEQPQLTSHKCGEGDGFCLQKCPDNLKIVGTCLSGTFKCCQTKN